MTETDELTTCAECGEEFDPAYSEQDEAPDLCATCNARADAEFWYQFHGFGR